MAHTRARIRIDQADHEVREGENLLSTCLALGYDLPYFCWHPALGSVGACRQCAIKQFKDENDTRGKIVMACMTPAANGARISIEDPEARAFRASVIEWLMTNHPHDCPVCDEGGECHLQDVTVMTGHAYRRFRFKKRAFRNQDLGPFVNHEMNRCIACYRCVRFYREYAGGEDFNVFSTHDRVYFGRHSDGRLESEFSGNLVEVCPTGVFTDKTLKKHYTRKWDLQTAPSICGHCGLGCNTIPGERYGALRRVRNRYHPEVNGYFLCDRGRYGYEYVNSEKRIRQIWLRSAPKSTAEPVSHNEALAAAARGRLIGIGSPRASLEANFALRACVGPERFHLGVSDSEFHLLARMSEILKTGPVPIASLADAERADAVLVLGEDVMQTAPRLALALRQAVLNAPRERAQGEKIPGWQETSIRESIGEERGPLFIAATHPTRLDDVATSVTRGAPDDVARLGFAVAHFLHEDSPEVPSLDEALARVAKSIALALRSAKRPLVVAGTNAGSEAILRAAANVARALHSGNRETRLLLTCAEANSLGLALLGGKTLSQAFEAIDGELADTLIVLENDLFRRSEPSRLKAVLDKTPQLVLIDHTATAMLPRSSVVLPSTTPEESTGTLVNNEGRAQRHFCVFVPEETRSAKETNEKQIQESWRWLRDLGVAAGHRSAGLWRNLDDLTARLVLELPELAALTHVSPKADFRVEGERIPRQSHRYSGRTSMHAQESVHEPEPPEDIDSPLAFSMEGYEGQPPAELISRYWAPRWNSVQALNKFQEEIGGPLRQAHTGVRLIEPNAAGEIRFYDGIPEPFVRREGEWLAVPIHHIFGSEELSAQSPAIGALAPKPYVALSPEDAAHLGTREGEAIDVRATDSVRSLPVRVLDGLVPGLIGIPVGLPGPERLDIGLDLALPRWLAITPRPLAGVA